MLQRAKNIVLRLIKDDSAGIMTMTAVMFPMLLGFAGFGIDVTSWYMERRITQSIVDTAAVEGAHENINYPDESEADLEIKVIAWSATIGYEAAQDTMQVNNPPLFGDHIGDEGFVEVINDRQATLYFVSAFYALFNGQDFSVTVQSRGVAGALSLGEACVVALSPIDNRALNFTGTTTVTSDCGIASNSTSASGLQVGGNATVEVAAVSVVGGYRNIGGGSLEDNDGGILIPNTPGSIVNDPYDGIPMPPEDFEDALVAPDDSCDGGPGLTFIGDPVVRSSVAGVPGVIGGGAPEDEDGGSPPASMVDGTAFVTLSPGSYCGGLKVQDNAYFSPGLYIIHNGDFDANAGSIMWGDGISFFLTGDSDADVGGMKDNGQVEIDFSATISGTYGGILFFQDISGDCAGGSTQDVTFNGGADMGLDGVVYIPACQVTINGGADAAPSCLKIYGYTIVFSGDSHVGNDQAVCESISLTGIGSTLIYRVQLVE